MSAGTPTLDPFDNYRYKPLPNLSSSRKRVEGPRLEHHLAVKLPQEFIANAKTSDRDIQLDVRLLTKVAFGCLLLLYSEANDFLFAEIMEDALALRNKSTTAGPQEALEEFTHLLGCFRFQLPLPSTITPSLSPSAQENGAQGFSYETQQQNRGTYSWLNLLDLLRSTASTSNHVSSPDIPNPKEY